MIRPEGIRETLWRDWVDICDKFNADKNGFLTWTKSDGRWRSEIILEGVTYSLKYHQNINVLRFWKKDKMTTNRMFTFYIDLKSYSISSISILNIQTGIDEMMVNDMLIS